MPPLPAWNEWWSVTRHGYKTSDGEGKVKFEYMLKERQQGLYNVVLWFNCRRFLALKPTIKKVNRDCAPCDDVISHRS